MKLQSSH